MPHIDDPEDLRASQRMDKFQPGRVSLQARTKSICKRVSAISLGSGGINTPINTTKVCIDVRGDASKNINRDLRTSPNKCHGNQRHQPSKGHWGLMVMVLPVAIGPKTILLIIIFMSRNSVVSSNVLDVLRYAAGRLLARWRS